MWRNYMTVGVRALTKNRTYAFINIVGLAIGLAACLMLLVYVRYETNYDSWLPDAENTYQLQTYYTEKATGADAEPADGLLHGGPAAARRISRRSRSIVYASGRRLTVLRNGEALRDREYRDGRTALLRHRPAADAARRSGHGAADIRARSR